MRVTTHVLAALLAAGCLSGCNDLGRRVPYGTVIVNSGSSVVFQPAVEIDDGLLEVGVDRRLDPGIESGEFGPAVVPELARMTWISEGLSCHAIFEIRARVRQLANFEGSTIYFDVSGRTARAFVSPAMTYAGAQLQGAEALTTRELQCDEIPNWQRPADEPSSSEFVDPFKDVIPAQAP